jgi:hypothetical protein
MIIIFDSFSLFSIIFFLTWVEIYVSRLSIRFYRLSSSWAFWVCSVPVIFWHHPTRADDNQSTRVRWEEFPFFSLDEIENATKQDPIYQSLPTEQKKKRNKI